MNKTYLPKKKSPVNRFIVPVIMLIIFILIIVVFVITFLSMAGLTPGA